MVSGMTKLRVKGGVSSPFFQALLEVDCDADADNLIVTDKTPSLFATSCRADGVVKMIVPTRYGTTSNLVVGITDDDLEYAGKFVDGVKAQIIDGSVTDILS